MSNDQNKFADVPIRVKTWLYILVVFAIGISNTFAMKIFVSWICFQCFYEFLRLSNIDSNRIFSPVFVGLSQFLLLYFFHINDYFIYSFVLGIIVLIYYYLKKLSSIQLIKITLALVICLFSYAYLYFVREKAHGIYLIIFLIVITELNDVFQYLMGKFFGKHKITPNISPNKTLEGLLGGILLTTILSNVLGYFILDTDVISNTILGLILGIFGFFGDVLMSFVKRKSNIKDTGNLLPGHGGLLDRMDSLIFNAPIFFWLIPYFI